MKQFPVVHATLSEAGTKLTELFRCLIVQQPPFICFRCATTGRANARNTKNKVPVYSQLTGK